MTLVVLVGIILLLVAVLVFREPELRRWGARVARRREGTVRAAVGRFQPRDIQRQALALIKEQAMVSIGYAHLPSDVKVFLNPEDLERLGAAREHVTRELAEQVTQLDKKSAGGEVAYLLAARPQIKLEAIAQLPSGTVEIAPAWLEGTSALTAMISTDDEVPDPAAQRLRIEADGLDPIEVVLHGKMTIGRAPGSTIPINHQGVSRNHAVLEAAGSEVTITDLDSLNGVEFDGIGRIRPNAPVRIEPGEVAHLGRHVRLELISDRTEVQPAREAADGS